MATSEFQFALNGVTFGRGTNVHITNVTGFGLGPKRVKVFSNPGEDGQQWGREYRDGSTITFEGEIRCDGDPATAWSVMVSLRTAFDGGGTGGRTGTKTTQALTMTPPGGTEITIPGRPDKFDPALATLGIGRIQFSATFDTAGPLT